MKYDIVTIGSATVDQFADTDSELIQIQTSTSSQRLIAFPLGSKLLVRELNLTVGGGGTNSAVSFSRQGLKTAFLGKIGADGHGDTVIKHLARSNIDFIGPRAGVTGTSIILNSFAKDRTILAYKGANNELAPDELPDFEAPWVYLSSMLGQSLDTIVGYLSNSNHQVAFNPSNYQAERGHPEFAELLRKVDVLVMNKEEACLFMQMQESNPTLPTLFRAMLALPPRIFAITNGANGASLCDRKSIFQGFPIPNIEVLETTGAGDAFGSTLTAAIMRKQSMPEALNQAMSNSESVLQHRGAKEKLLTREELAEVCAANSQRKIEHLEI